MKKKFAIITAAVLSGAMLFSAGVFAARNYTVKVNDKVVNVDVKEINGSTYVPLRAVSQMLGAKVDFDPATSTIKINMPTSTTTQPTTPATSDTGNRKNPAALGTELSFTVKNTLDSYKGKISIEQVIRGEEALMQVQDANMFNDAPDEGYEYMLAKINIAITDNANDDKVVDISQADFTLVSSSGKDYNRKSVVAPEPSIDASLYKGASNNGWAVFQVKKDDANPVITFGRKYDGTGGVWFKTK